MKLTVTMSLASALPAKCRLIAGLALVAASLGAAAQEPARGKLVDESRAAALQLMQKVRGDLVKELDASGPGGAMLVCKYSAVESESALSRLSGWRISRVTLKPRNPTTGTPDVWEQKVLAEFDRRAVSGEKAETLEHAEVVNEPLGRYFRYMKALPVAPICLGCHGAKENLSSAVQVRLSGDYPFDKAIGYKVGQVRGAVSIKRPL